MGSLRRGSETMAKQWNYLGSNAFQVRYFIAAGIVRKYDNILELGSYKTPIFHFLNDDTKHVICVDPMVFEQTKSETQATRNLDYRCLPIEPFQGKPYALVILGLDMPLSYKLKRFLTDCDIAVIEFPEDEQWKRSRETFDRLVAELSLNILLSVHVDLDRNDFSQYSTPADWPPRAQRFIFVVSARHKHLDDLNTMNPFAQPLREIDTSQSRLINPEFTREMMFPEADFEFSHGASAAANYLGSGILYYAIPYMNRSKVCVCLGSGGGFVPRLMRQAQRDIGLATLSKTILIDGNMGDYGRPNWLDEGSWFRKNYADIDLLLTDTLAAAEELGRLGVRIDYLHIDADHSAEGSLADFQRYQPLMNPGTLITFHDTRPQAHESVTAWKTIETIKNMGHEVLNLDHLGNGVAVIKMR